ncbi:MAG: ABC transporter ATP-binding protein [Sodalis sp. (in: enterobacteria)]|uniref:ABC transporter ATP-binding protein n=1 Tax=Sodalis sp. (in: enterobacteria) TaxID=1898979 RepID=UPI0039E3FA46
MTSPSPQAGNPLLQVHDLKKYFPAPGQRGTMLKAVDGVSFPLAKGETLALIGESGSGKTTVGKTLLRLHEPTAGKAIFQNVDIFELKPRQLRHCRRDMQIIFQDPFASLNPRMTVEELIAEPFDIHGQSAGPDRTRRIARLLELVGLATYHARRYPHEFSGGQRQRIGIARALALDPKLIICDEPVSALDVSIQSQILNLLRQLQQELGLSYLFIAHGMAAVKHISHRVAVMYLGKIMEISPTRLLYAAPLHPYSEALISAIPVQDPTVKRHRIILAGDIPSPLNVPSGCRFHTRCPYAASVGEKCRTVEPTLSYRGDGRWVACHLHEKQRAGDISIMPT